MRTSAIRLLMALLLGVAVLGWSPLTAGADDQGRPDGAEAGTPVVEAPDRGEDPIGEPPEWDGDGPPPRPFITTNANNSIGGSLCVGFDCIANEAFGFDTLRLKENNLRIHFEDTSTIAGFPTRDWRIFANSSASGGGDFFSISDADAGFDAFRIDGDSLANALTIDAQGDVGLGLRPAALDLHIRRGDTPSIRLEQDGSSGFTPQIFDVAGNEAGFFVRDATSGSTLPLRIRPGVASSAVDLHADGVGIFNSNPDADVEIRDGGDSGSRVRIRFDDTNAGVEWEIGTSAGGDMVWSLVGSGSNEMTIQQDGDLVVSGDVFANNQQVTPLDKAILDQIRADNAALAARLAAAERQNAELAERVAALEALLAQLTAAGN